MSHKLVNLTLSVIALLVIVVTLLFATQTISDMSSNTHTGYDAYVEQLHQTQFDKTGMLSSVFTAPTIKHYASDAHSIVFHPHIIMHNKKGIWDITADTATTADDNTTLFLKGHVLIIQPASHNTPKTVISTDYATVYPKRSYAQTSDYVTINRATTTIAGQGATADMKLGIIKLLSHTRGHYAPT